MKIILLALGSSGDILPSLVLGQALQARGHEVRLISTRNFLSLCQTYQIELMPLKADSQRIVRENGANMLKLSQAFSQLTLDSLPELAQMLPKLQGTDFILTQLPLGLVALDLAEVLGARVMQTAVIPLLPTRQALFMGIPQVGSFNQWQYALLSQLTWQQFRAGINRWRTHELGLSPHPFAGVHQQLGTYELPLLQGVSKHIVPHEPEWGAHVHTTGYWLPRSDNWQPSDALSQFLQAGEPPIFIGFGSMPVPNPVQTTQLLLDAIRLSGQRAILHTGWAGLGQDDLPSHIFLLRYAPYDWLFPKMRFIIHHGGSGTTAFGAWSGQPSMVVPFVFDQFYWGKRLMTLGVGPAPLPFKQLTARTLTDRIWTAVHDHILQQNAAQLGEKIRAEDGVAQAIAIIEGDTAEIIR